MSVFKRAFAAVFSLLVLLCFSLPALAAEESKKTVRVAFWERGGRFEADSSGKLSGYDVELLDDISEYCDFTVEYVECASPQDAVNALDDGRAELVTSMVQTPERMENYLFSANSTGVTYSGLIGLASREDLIYQDYAKIKDCTVGYEGQSGKTDEYLSYLKDTRGVTKLKGYASVTELRDALNAGEIDLMATGANNIRKDEKLIDKFGAESVYYMSSKSGTELMKSLNEAMTALSLHMPDYIGKLEQKYFPVYYSSQYTKSELDYIASCPVLKVGVHADWIPVAWQNDSGEFRGIMIDLMKLVSEYSGIDFEFFVIPEGMTNSEALASGNYDLVVPVDEDMSGIDPDETYVTAAIDTPNINLGMFKDTLLPEQGIRVGTISDLSELSAAVRNMYPNADITEFSTQTEALEALKKGSIDAIANSTYVWYYLREIPSFKNIVLVPNETMSVDYCIGMNRDKLGHSLINILNSAIYKISDEERAGILAAYTTGQLYRQTPWDYLTEAAPFILLALVIIGVLLALIVTRNRYIKKLKLKNTELKRATCAKSQFLSNMSHDIRTPMNAVINLTSLAYDDMDNPAELIKDLDKIRTSGTFLLGLINDMLDMSYVENGKIGLHPEVYSYEDFDSYIDSVIAPLCLKKNIEFTRKNLGAHPKLFVDKTRFNQIFFNLLSNAVKYTDTGGKVEFRAENVVVNDAVLCADFTVADTGCGMSEEFQKKMFLPFERENTVEAYTGTGLGLAITKEIVDKMGGSITVDSKKNVGTKIHVHLDIPLATEDQLDKARLDTAEEEPKEETEENEEPHRVLIAEDHPLNREIVIRVLKKRGIISECAEDGQIALDMFRESEPGYYNAILMDIRMPNMDGLEATRAIRALDKPDAGTVPIIAMTANAFDEDMEKSMAAGMSAHLSKPLEPQLLFDTLDEFMK